MKPQHSTAGHRRRCCQYARRRDEPPRHNHRDHRDRTPTTKRLNQNRREPDQHQKPTEMSSRPHSYRPRPEPTYSPRNKCCCCCQKHGHHRTKSTNRATQTENTETAQAPSSTMSTTQGRQPRESYQPVAEDLTPPCSSFLDLICFETE
ncbi:hypothetical protein BaRGS_00026316 [Batillaria attramentaria]|uniref:Uncharacterized protein n=1 Tax=Batillaria attramentaria TaxID=370345 RepID=A0ABD0K566_9CAEN